MQTLAKIVVTMNNRSSTDEVVDDVRLDMFVPKHHSINSGSAEAAYGACY